MNIITPLNKKVLVEPETREEVSKGGIIIPQTANQKVPTKGRVIAVAEDTDLKLKISSGDIVLFSKFAGSEIVVPAGVEGQKDRTYQIISAEDLLAVITNDGK